MTSGFNPRSHKGSDKARISKDALTSERIKLQHEMSPLPVALYG